MKRIKALPCLTLLVVLLALLYSPSYAAGSSLGQFVAYNGENKDGTVFTVTYDGQDHGFKYSCLSTSIYNNVSDYTTKSSNNCTVTRSDGTAVNEENYSLVLIGSKMNFYLHSPDADTYTVHIRATWKWIDTTSASQTFTIIINPTDISTLYSISGYNEVFDGLEHNAFTMNSLTNVPENQYTIQYSQDGTIFSSILPTVRNVSDSGLCFIKIISNSNNFSESEYIASVMTSVTKRNVTIVPDYFTKTYGDADPTLTYSINNAVPNEPLTNIVLNRVAGEDVGEYTISATFSPNVNYKVACNNAALTIIPSNALSVTADSLNVQYDGKPHRIEPLITDKDGNDVSNIATIRYRIQGSNEYTNEMPDFVNAGAYTIGYTVSLKNYETIEGTWNVIISGALLYIEVEDVDICIGDQPVTVAAHVFDEQHNDITSASQLYYQYGESGTYSATPPLFYTIGQHQVLIKAEKDNHETAYATAVVTISDHLQSARNAVAPTCDEIGMSGEIYCTLCGRVLSEGQLIPAQGHTIVIDPYVSPTSTSSGLTEGSHCSVCGKIIIEQESIPLTYEPSPDGMNFSCYLHILPYLNQTTESLYYQSKFRPYLAGAILSEVFIDQNNYMDVPDIFDCVNSAVSSGSVYLMLSYAKDHIKLYVIGDNGYLIVWCDITVNSSSYCNVTYYNDRNAFNPPPGGWELMFSGFQYSKDIDSYYLISNRSLMSYLIRINNTADLLNYVRDRLNSTFTGWGFNTAGKVCYYNSGNIVTGLQAIENTVYFFENDGSVFNGWKFIGDQLYYFMPDLAHSYAYLIGAHVYCFNTDGTLAKNSWYTPASGLRMFTNELGITILGWDDVKRTGFIVGETGDRRDLNTFLLPAHTVSIESEALSGTKAQVIVVPSSCTSILDGAFSNCSQLKFVLLNKETVSISDSAFSRSDIKLIPLP